MIQTLPWSSIRLLLQVENPALADCRKQNSVQKRQQTLIGRGICVIFGHGEYYLIYLRCAVLASMSFTAGYGAGTAFATGDASDAVEIYDRYFAGFADVFTVGQSTNWRRQIYGQTAINNHQGAFFNLGRLAGGIVGILLGTQAPGLAELGQAGLAAQVAFAYDLFSSGFGIFESGKNIMEGRATLWDVLPFLPILGWFNLNYKAVWELMVVMLSLHQGKFLFTEEPILRLKLISLTKLDIL